MSEEYEGVEGTEAEENAQHDEPTTPEGFIDKDKWVEMGRNPDDWRSPDEFKEFGEKTNSILKKQRDELKQEIDSFRQDFESYRTRQQQITAQKEKEAYERAKRDYEEQVTMARTAKAKAIEEMDSEGFLRAEDVEKSLRPPKPPQEEIQQTPGLTPEVTEFINKPENSWYANDKELRDYADFLSFRYVDQIKAGQMTVKQALEDISGQVRRQFPGKFGQSKSSAGSVESGGGPQRKKGKDYRDLPSEARAACDRFVKRGIMTKDQYVKDYFGE